MALRYDETYAVELYDRVEVEIAGRTYDGEVTALYPRLGMLRVAYLDHLDWTRQGEPRRRSARVPLAAATLIGRDG